MKKNEKAYKTLRRVVSIIVLSICLFSILGALVKKITIKIIKEQMQITNESIVEVYNIPMREELIVKVINEYIMDEQLFLVNRKGIIWVCDNILEEEVGISDVVDLVFHQWKEEIFVEVAYSTNKGNGAVALYWFNEKLTPVIVDMGAVDRNLDTTTNAIYEDGRMFMYFQENNSDSFFPDVIIEGIELVYGYETEEGKGDELIYQRNLISRLYQWDEEKKDYIQTEEKKQLLQQIEGVYPIRN